MGIIRNAFAGDVRIRLTPLSSAEEWLHGSTTLAGVDITAESALKISAVYACTAVTAESVAVCPFGMYERTGDEERRAATEHPVHALIHDRPNRYQTSMEWQEMMIAWALLRGKGISEIAWKGDTPLGLVPLHPDLVTEETTPDGTLRFRYADPVKQRERILLDDEVFVLRGRFGKSVRAYFRDTMGLSAAMAKWAALTYGRGTKAGGVIQHPGKQPLSDKARANLRAALDEYSIGGPRAGRPLLLEEGMSWADATMSAHDAEFVATHTLQIAEIARGFRMPLHKIQELSRSTNNNIEHQGIEFASDVVLPWSERTEQSVARDLITDPARFYSEHNLNGLYRGDMKSRYEAYATGVLGGFLTRNEPRKWENLNPIGGLDEPLQPMNMATVDASGKATKVEFRPRDERAGYLSLLVRDGARRIVRKELGTITKIVERNPDQAQFREDAEAFYRAHAADVQKMLRLPPDAARQYTDAQCARLLDAGPAVFLDEEIDHVDTLSRMALEQEAAA